MPTSTASSTAVPVPAAATAPAGFSTAELLEIAKECGENAGSDYRIEPERIQPLVFTDPKTRRSHFAVALTYGVRSDTGSSGTGSYSTVVIARASVDGAAKNFYWCGDSFLEGKLKTADRNKRIDNALSTLPLVKQGAAKALLESSYAGEEANTSPSSHFWSRFGSDPRSGGCKHVRHVLHKMTESSQLAPALARLEATYADWFSATGASSPHVMSGSVAPAGASALECKMRAKSRLFAEIIDVAGPRVRNKLPVLILGEAGYGKTYSFRELGKSGLYDAFHEFSIYPDSEGSDFIGGPRQVALPLPDGRWERAFVHQDSPVVRAMRDAGNGKQVALLLDEIGNARKDVLNVLKNLLNPDSGMYQISTGRPGTIVDGVAVPEVVVAPVENLAVFATANIGSGYEVQFGDRAVMNRFYSIYHEIDHRNVLEAMRQDVSSRRFPDDAAKGLERFYMNMVKLHKDRQVERLPNPRDFSRIVGVCENADQIPLMAARFAPQWVGEELDGRPNKDQVYMVVTAVKSSWAIQDATWPPSAR